MVGSIRFYGEVIHVYVIVFGLIRLGLDPTMYHTEASTLAMTASMLFNFYGY